VRSPVVRNSRESLSLSAICSTPMAPMCADASSMASGMPSSLRQMSTTTGAFASVSAKPRERNLARSTNNRTDS
jgi:hypothetical protein